ncbi:hypothetical protein BC835DRAFT_592072 [Cytidiella melzeri]|nr:hypothetical protein BC835DRAFT_592072 [Cytidiella melzeri]
MATYTVHPPHIYDPHTNGPSSQDYYTPYDDDDDTLYPCSQYYPPYLVGVDQQAPTHSSTPETPIILPSLQHPTQQNTTLSRRRRPLAAPDSLSGFNTITITTPTSKRVPSTLDSFTNLAKSHRCLMTPLLVHSTSRPSLTNTSNSSTRTTPTTTATAATTTRWIRLVLSYPTGTTPPPLTTRMVNSRQCWTTPRKAAASLSQPTPTTDTATTPSSIPTPNSSP